MDPRFVVNRDEFNNLQTEVKHHADRLSRLERRQQDDATLKSVWNSPFPSVLAGTPQQEPVDPANPNDYFDLDEQGDHLLGSLHLDPTDDEPIRRGNASRANSVRFAESAIHGTGWNSQPRNSGDFGLVRPGSSLLMERSLSHKSDGRHSSAGHSVHSIHSAMSGRASSLGLDVDDDDSSIDMPVPPPSLFIMGSVPSIVRCWLTPKFSHESLLYADICTGSQKSTLDFALAKELDLHHTLERDINGNYTITIPVFLAEAIITHPHSRNGANSHQIPSILVTFEIVGFDTNDVTDSVGLKIFLGSDALRANSADVLLSQNKVVLYSIERDKLAVPFVRPEDENVFRNIVTRNMTKMRTVVRLDATAAPFVSGSDVKSISSRSVSKGPDSRQSFADRASRPSSPEPVFAALASAKSALFPTPSSVRSELSDTEKLVSKNSSMSLSENGSFNITKDMTISTIVNNTLSGAASNGASTAQTTPTTETDKRRESNAGIWGSWRNGAISNERENGLSGYQPASKGGRNMKVLKPNRSTSSRVNGNISSAGTGNSSLDTTSTSTSWNTTSWDSKRKDSTSGSNGQQQQQLQQQPHSSFSATSGTLSMGLQSQTPSTRWENKRSVSVSEPKMPMGYPVRESGRQGSSAASSTSGTTGRTTANPVGVASAFSWMNPNGSSKPRTTVGE